MIDKYDQYLIFLLLFLLDPQIKCVSPIKSILFLGNAIHISENVMKNYRTQCIKVVTSVVNE